MADEVYVTIAKAQLYKPLVIVQNDGSVWLAIQLRWWDLATLLWWFLYPSTRRARVRMKVGGEGQIGIRCHAMYLSDDVYNLPKKDLSAWQRKT